MKIMEIKKLINRQTVNWTQSEKKKSELEISIEEFT